MEPLCLGLKLFTYIFWGLTSPSAPTQTDRIYMLNLYCWEPNCSFESGTEWWESSDYQGLTRIVKELLEDIRNFIWLQILLTDMQAVAVQL